MLGEYKARGQNGAHAFAIDGPRPPAGRCALDRPAPSTTKIRRPQIAACSVCVYTPRGLLFREQGPSSKCAEIATDRGSLSADMGAPRTPRIPRVIGSHRSVFYGRVEELKTRLCWRGIGGHGRKRSSACCLRVLFYACRIRVKASSPRTCAVIGRNGGGDAGNGHVVRNIFCFKPPLEECGTKYRHNLRRFEGRLIFVIK